MAAAEPHPRGLTRALLLLVLAVAGCHWLLPFERGEIDARPDGTRLDRSKTDAPKPDRSPAADGQAGDAPTPCPAACTCSPPSSTFCSIKCQTAGLTIECWTASDTHKVYCKCNSDSSDTDGNSIPLDACMTAYLQYRASSECPSPGS